MRHPESELTSLVRSVVEPMGYELVGVDYFQRGRRGAVLRVYIDYPGDAGSDAGSRGITLDDCGRVSHQLSGVLDVQDPIAGHYDLEVSSPGLDRPLFTAEHFDRFRGRKVRVRLTAKLDERRNLEGEIAGREQERVVLRVDGESREIPLAMIESARLVPHVT
ncbi:MAG: ribosome maturation factor RimP [Candidatus Thiosymbion ectosymbiont of Robbea hypermnestra]|nr:ribosome maturation factor RimP [Candidatus Thiosymbion ectosymbiont of Robbea hypermnestra]